MGKNIEYNQLAIEPYKSIDDNPAYIFDIDGTLAHKAGRHIHDYAKVYLDEPDTAVFALMFQLKIMGNDIIILSGRPDDCRDVTEAWLETAARDIAPYAPVMMDLVPGEHQDTATLTHGHVPWWDGPFMRRAGDYRPDYQVKLEIFNENIRENYNIAGVFDDRDQCVRLWRDLGLKCYQVAYGDF